ncbi:PAS domain-containing protein [Aestuariispira insulae]|uniref:PAS domain-containing protein n=1 Tax=Aestuariispira insulae TaxID=1461337 RepID=A0A3D9HG97_9PROT|nr:PAS domain-containing protein [Aestuariispira insulae]RED48509.1 PAS domain-containing protein [Aestuariispira insulae]
MGLEPGAGLPDPRHQDLFDYWHAKCAGRIAPPRQAIDPVDLTALLPNLFIFKVYEEPERDYEPTLLGTALVSVLGRDFTGSRFYEMYHGESAKILRRQYDHVVDSHQPFYAQLDAEWMNKDFISYDRLLLPLSEGGETVSRLLGCSFFTRKDR